MCDIMHGKHYLGTGIGRVEHSITVGGLQLNL